MCFCVCLGIGLPCIACLSVSVFVCSPVPLFPLVCACCDYVVVAVVYNVVIEIVVVLVGDGAVVVVVVVGTDGCVGA